MYFYGFVFKFYRKIYQTESHDAYYDARGQLPVYVVWVEIGCIHQHDRSRCYKSDHYRAQTGKYCLYDSAFMMLSDEMGTVEHKKK